MNAALKIEDKGYAISNALVSTEWVSQNTKTQKVKIVESNEDQLLYSSGHIENAVEIDWISDLNDPINRDYLNKDQFEALMSKKGISNDTTVVLYGDRNNWWACYAFWIFKLYGHADVRIMDGGRLNWLNEGRALVKEKPAFAVTSYKAPERDDKTYRAFRNDVMEHIKNNLPLVDVRSPEEYSGARLHMEGYPNEGSLRGGHIKGAKNVPWARAINPEDGTFKTAESLRKIYQEEIGLTPNDNVVAYCRIGERSSHTWFVLHYLLGFKNVRNYDGSWTEWGNLVGAPIEK